MPTASSPARSVALFVRSLSPTETPAPRHADRVRALEAADRVDEASVTVWGSEIELSTRARRTPTGKCVLDRVADFRAWADERGVSMGPFFETREVSSSLTGEEYTALRLPVTCLAEYDGDELVHVAPYSTGEAICSVADRLRRLDEDAGVDDDRGDGAAVVERPADGPTVESAADATVPTVRTP
ncbi:hypothetical protein C475_04806 [Halosimplex carlsbadense 2-9-1]|uniref:Uncharacterized protein n=1 Tax=Halosimplex carlsbadense 2-9-1 TaxID=797114 RepID=M0D448_9EURY|nr:HTH domain-containing protein [Halosimplex carlsbadense]ELZ28929.1 hypothetical protein C475_04806 [Halosimplex carlsbadense 2-9-1]